MSELHLYDFDGTLFRSPHEPMVWEGPWWNDVRSLMPPCVPDRPGSEWWVGDTVNQAKTSTSDTDVFSILSTGRQDQSGFRYRIPELLKQKGLSFDLVKLAPPSNTLSFKKRLLGSSLKRYPHIDTVRVWDDRPSHLKAFKEVAQKAGIAPENIHLHQVRAKSHAPGCEEADFLEVTDQFSDSGKGWYCRYLAVFLDASSKAALAKEFSFLHDNIKNDHLTLTYACQDPSEFEDMVGKRVNLKVVGHKSDDKAQAVVVAGVDRLDRGVPHITLSHASGVKPKYSNELLKGGYERISGPTLRGVIDTFPRSLKRKASSTFVGSMSMLGGK